VAFEICDFRHFRVFPDAKLVVDIAMGGEYLLVVWVPQERTDLTVRGDLVNHLARLGVPELDTLIATPASRGKKISLPGAPRQSFYRSFVFS